MKAPAFQFYVSDFIMGVGGMCDEDVGVYIKMLAHQWDKGSLPNCPKQIKILVNSRKIPSQNVLKKFQVGEDGFLRNARLEKERKKQEDYSVSRVNNAKKRWDKNKKNDACAFSSISTADALHLQSSPSGNPIVPKRDEAVEVVEEWNRKRLPHWKQCLVPEPWLNKIRVRLKNPFWRDNWKRALDEATKSPCFQSKRDWNPNLEWFLRDDQKKTVASLLEGKFNFNPDSLSRPVNPKIRTITRSLDENPYENRQT